MNPTSGRIWTHDLIGRTGAPTAVQQPLLFLRSFHIRAFLSISQKEALTVRIFLLSIQGSIQKWAFRFVLLLKKTHFKSTTTWERFGTTVNGRVCVCVCGCGCVCVCVWDRERARERERERKREKEKEEVSESERRERKIPWRRKLVLENEKWDAKYVFSWNFTLVKSNNYIQSNILIKSITKKNDYLLL